MNQNLKKMISYYKPYRAVFAADMLFATLSAAVALTIPLVVRYVTSTLIYQQPQMMLRKLFLIGIGLFVLLALDCYSRFFIGNYGHVMGAKMEYDMRAELFGHLQKLSFSFYDDAKVGQLMSRITTDLFDISELMHHGPENIILSVIKIAGALIILVNINPMLAVAAFAILPFMLIYAFIFGVVFEAREQYFPAFIFIGITAWDFFNRCLTQSVKLLKNNKSIVTKVYIPKFILLISKMFFNGYKMLFSFGIIVIMIIYFRIPITLNILYVIPSFIVLFVVTFACMTHLMHYGVFIQDLANVTNIVLRMVFYMTGIFYNIEKRLPAQYTGILMKGNPMALVLSSLRKCILYGQAPDVKWLIIWFIIGIIVAALGVRKIYKNENSYVKVI